MTGVDPNAHESVGQVIAREARQEYESQLALHVANMRTAAALERIAASLEDMAKLVAMPPVYRPLG